MPAELLADLYDPNLVITPHYVGAEPTKLRQAARRSRPLAKSALIALVTTFLVVPLTLMLSHPSAGRSGAGTTEPHASSATTGSPLATARVQRPGGERPVPSTRRRRSRPAPLGSSHPCRTASTSCSQPTTSRRHAGGVARRSARLQRQSHADHRTAGG